MNGEVCVCVCVVVCVALVVIVDSSGDGNLRVFLRQSFQGQTACRIHPCFV